MRCLYCGKGLALLKRWTGGGEFCSDAHRQRYQEEYNQLALNRLLQAKPVIEPETPAKTKIPEDKPTADATPKAGPKPPESPRAEATPRAAPPPAAPIPLPAATAAAAPVPEPVPSVATKTETDPPAPAA